ncbi:MAG TPA: carboxypeptidase-like regulatory domain-containing protein [Acidimicrobiales bacterium]|nr:carboxypeptidase-like regulatory domain-containing protein [Acidimicrobiales bacterium]
MTGREPDRRGPRAAAAVALAVVLLPVGCRGSEDEGSPASSVATTRPPEATTTTAATTTTLVTVPPGNPRPVTTLSPAIGPGKATLGGTVSGPEGPVAGATVRIERLVGEQVAATTVTSDAGGQWTLSSVNGGRYRLRAWRPPDLAMLRPTLVFVEATESRSVALGMARYGEGNVVAAFSPGPPTADKPATLVLTVSDGGIDGEGVLHASPRPGVTVQLLVTAGLSLESPDTTVTDGSGNASFTVRCVPPGTPAATALIDGTRRLVDVPPCGVRG